MSAALAFWAQKLEPGTKVKLNQQEDLDIKITGVTFDETLVDQERTSVKVHVQDRESGKTASFVIANLIPGKIESQLLDLIVGEDEELELEVIGKNTVYLSGNLIYQAPPEYDDDDEDDEDEDAHLLQEISSDVEMHPDEFLDEDEEEEAGRFEEIEEQPAPALKAPESNASKKENNQKNSGNKGKPQTPAAKPNNPSGGKQFGNKPSGNQQSGGKPVDGKLPGNKPSGNQPGASNGGAPGQGKNRNKNKNKNKNTA